MSVAPARPLNNPLHTMTTHHPTHRVTKARPSAKQTLTLAQRERLRRALQSDRARLLRAHEARLEEAAEVDLDVADDADLAEGVLEDRQRAALEEHDRWMLGEIEHALEKFENGTYGYSEKSGHLIRFERLQAVPWARVDSDEASPANSRPPGRP